MPGSDGTVGPPPAPWGIISVKAQVGLAANSLAAQTSGDALKRTQNETVVIYHPQALTNSVTASDSAFGSVTTRDSCAALLFQYRPVSKPFSIEPCPANLRMALAVSAMASRVC